MEGYDRSEEHGFETFRRLLKTVHLEGCGQLDLQLVFNRDPDDSSWACGVGRGSADAPVAGALGIGETPDKALYDVLGQLRRYRDFIVAVVGALETESTRRLFARLDAYEEMTGLSQGNVDDYLGGGCGIARQHGDPIDDATGQGRR